MNEFAAHASAAIRIARHANGLESAAPDVARNQLVVQSFRAARKKLRRFGGFDRSDYSCSRVQHTDRIASIFRAKRRMIASTFEQTRETCRFAGPDRHGDAIAADSRGIDPGNAE